MTQSNENGSRLDRIEVILLELTGASIRHDNEFSRINASLDRVAKQQETNTQAIAQNQQVIAQNQQAIAQNQRAITQNQQAIAQNQQAITQIRQAIAQNQRAIAQLTAEQQLSRQDINILTASIQDLRNLVADYIQGRSGT